MQLFRISAPRRTSKSGIYKAYNQYKHILKDDFNSRCGYCNDHHNFLGGWRVMQIDHFAPKIPFKEWENEYENLVYSCFFCNNAKSNDWVTTDKSQSKSIDGKKGYVHPIEEEYNELFKRNFLGAIIPQNELAFYIYTNLNLGLKRHELLFTMDKIDEIVDKIEEVENYAIDDKVKCVLKQNKFRFLEIKHKIQKKFNEINNAR